MDPSVIVAPPIRFTESMTDATFDAVELGFYGFWTQLGKQRNHVDVEDLLRAVGVLSRYPLQIYSRLHRKFNLCGNRKYLAWNGNTDQDEKCMEQLKKIELELHALSKVGGSVVTECGFYRNSKDGLRAAARSILAINFNIGYKLVLMNSLNQHHAVATTLDHLAWIINNVAMYEHVSVGINLLYLYKNGLYNFSINDEIKRFFKDYERLMKYPPTFVWIEDSKVPFGEVRMDEESTYIGYGLWSMVGLITLLKYCYINRITILTSNTTDAYYLQHITEQLFCKTLTISLSDQPTILNDEQKQYEAECLD